MDVMETFMVKDYTEYSDPEERQQRRDNIRAEIIRYNETSNGSTDDQQVRPITTADYIEPTNDGYPGLEPPLG